MYRSRNNSVAARFSAPTQPAGSRDARKARRHTLLEYFYIGGLSIRAAAEQLNLSYNQALNDKRLADAELYLAIKSRQE